MGDEETVKIDITVRIDTTDTVDTGYTVTAWNDLTDAQRGKVYQDNWDLVAGNADDGGVRVLTEGATGL
jgi:hypothetical protein